LTTRVTNILTRPSSEWSVIAAEPSDVASLLRDYAAPLAAIPAICQWLGMSLVGVTVPFVGTVRIGIVRGFANAVITWVFTVIAAWVAAFIIEKLAPSFASRGDTIDALKLVVYASTPVWVAGVLYLVPALSGLMVLAALYAVYLFYLGLQPVMHTPPEKAVAFMVVAAIVCVLVTIILATLATTVSGVGAYAVTFALLT
jgi:uncharacterized membrane protein (DUF485 family)